MQNYRFKSLFVALALVLFSALSSFAQQPALTKKESLILEFRRLTGADRVNMNINLSTDDVLDTLSAIVEKDPELTEAQKVELRQSVKDAYAPVDKLAKDFFANKDELNRLTEEVIFKLYDTTFNEAELGDAIAYYNSSTGRKTAAFLPTLSAQVQQGFINAVVPKLQSLIKPVSVAEEAKLKQKIADLKSKKPSK